MSPSMVRPNFIWLFFSLLLACLARPLQLCNGHAEYCSRRYSNITFLGAHNSPFVGSLPTQNQDVPPLAQLDYGIRFLTTRLRRRQGKVFLCHTSCTLENAGTLEAFLQRIRGWLEQNGNEVITLLLTQAQNFEVEVLDGVFERSGIKPFAFVPATSPDVLRAEQWPRLGEMISANKRLVVFLDYGADPARVPYLLNEFSYYFETRFSPTLRAFRKCDIHRPPPETLLGNQTESLMYIVNHNLNKRIGAKNLLVPDRYNAPRTNSVAGKGGIGQHIARCLSAHQRRPNVVLVDYVTQGEVLDAQDILNGFKPPQYFEGSSVTNVSSWMDLTTPDDPDDAYLEEDDDEINELAYE